MQRDLLPLFPLSVVLLPGTVLPLHIFEERYQEMIGEAIRSSSEFGVVQAKDQGILRVGCTASIDDVVQRYDDGRMDIITRGHRRFQIEEVDAARSYLRARVSYFSDDEDEVSNPLDGQRALAAFQELQRVGGESESVPDLNDPQASFALAHVSTDLDFRQTLLALRSEAQRMRLVARHLEQSIERKRLEAATKKVAGQNGHSRHHPDFSS